MDSGRNCPWLIEAEAEDGDIIEVVAKLGSSECGLGGLVREAYCSMLAADLNLPVAEPFVIQIDDDFLDTLSANQRARAEKHREAFGVRFVPNLFAVHPAAPFSTALLAQAADAFLFDAGVVNGDRLVSKPNCLTDGRSQLLLIDHEMCLVLHGRGFLVQDPWSYGSLSGMTVKPTEHLFYSKLKPSRADSPRSDFSVLAERLASISTSRIDEYQSAIPPLWDEDEVSSDIASYLKELVGNASGVKVQVEGVLS